MVDSATAAGPGAPGPPDLEAMRRGYVRTAIERGGAVEEVAGIEDVVVPRDDGGRVPGRAYTPVAPADGIGVVVWLHGGGWIVGNVDGVDRVSRSLANASGAVVLSVDYRLAPEDPFPAAVQDADAAVAWATGDGARRVGASAGMVVVGGDSAGGNLAAVAARHARDEGRPVRGQLLVYPITDSAMDTASYAEFAETPVLGRADMELSYQHYLGDLDGAHPDASPLRATDLAGLPPAYVAIAGHDPLRDEGLAYAEALRAAGVAVSLRRYDDMLHGFLRWGGVVDSAGELIAELGRFTRGVLAGEGAAGAG